MVDKDKELDEIELLSAYIDGELDKIEQERLNAFLAKSADGRQELEKVLHMKSLLASSPPVKAPEDLLDFLEEKALEKMNEPRPFTAPVWRWAWATSFASLVIMAGVWIGVRRTPQTISLETLLAAHVRHNAGVGLHQSVIRASQYTPRLEKRHVPS